MSGYIVLARKWRPAQFSDIVGQEPIVRTLMNAVRSERVHQAYLFTGSRGIGKTSIARIFSKILRCESLHTDSDGLRSCDECSNCREIAAGTGVDVLEIDGASNNGVDAIREIRENAKFLPSSGSRKIYIIDEVHMLTTAAFNALLKTLEEPPAHVVFIFATTEPHKIPATILSRLQRFDFKRVTQAQIQGRLAEILRSEKIDFESGALSLLARASEGSMRDALSILDQVIAFSGGKVTAQAVRESIGLVPGQMIADILRSVLERKASSAIATVHSAHQQGYDLRLLTRQLIEFLHGTILATVQADGTAFTELSDEEWTELKTLSHLRPLEDLELIFQVFHHGLDWIARSPQPKIVLDVLLVKCSTAESLVTTANLASDSSSEGFTPGPHSTEKSKGQSPVTRTLAAPTSTTTASTSPSDPTTLIEEIRKVRPMLALLLEHAGQIKWVKTPTGTAQELHILMSSRDAGKAEQLQSKLYLDQISSIGESCIGMPVIPKVLVQDGVGESLASQRERIQAENEATARKAVLNHPVVQEARSLFGGELGPIEWRTHPSSKGSEPHAN